MKVLHVNNYWEKGGAESVFRFTIKALNEYYPDIDNYAAFTTDEKKDLPKYNKNNNIFIFDNWRWYNKIIGTFKYIYSIKNSRMMDQVLADIKPDIVHLHGFYSALSPSILTPLLKNKRKFGIKIVQTVHDYHLMCPNSSFYCYSSNTRCTDCLGKKVKLKILWKSCDRRGWIPSLIKGIRSIVSLNLLRHKEVVDFFIAPSLFIKDMLIKEGIPKRKIKVVRNPIQEECSIENIEFEKKRNEFVYFGRFSKEKNLPFLIKTFAEACNDNFLPEGTKLTLIGEGEELSLLASLVKNNYNISIKPFMDHKLLMDYLKNSKYLIMTSIWFENAPMAIIEAYQCGLIPLVPKIGGMKELVEYFGLGYLFSPEDKNSLKSALLSAIKNYNDDIKKLLKINEKLSKFHLKYYAREIIKIYFELNNQVA